MTTTTKSPNPRLEVVAERYQTFMSRHSSLMPTFAAIAILLLLMAYGEIFLKGDFITPGILSAILLDHAFLLVMAVGMTFVIITAGIDLSVGSVMAFTGILCAKLLTDGHPVWIVIPIMLLGGALIGLLIGVLIQHFEVQPFIASLAGLFLARGLAYVVSLSSITVKNPQLEWLGRTRFRLGDWYIAPTGILALLVVAAAFYVLHFTRFGRTVYAVGGNEQSARLMGLNVTRTKILVYVICGVTAAIAGLILTAYSGAGYPRNGIGAELDVIAAVVIGGTLLTGGRGYVLGSFVGVLVYGTIKNIINFQSREQAWMQITIGVILLLFIVIQRVIVVRSERQT